MLAKDRTKIVLAVLSLIGVLVAAMLANWDKLFGPVKPPLEPATQRTEGSGNTQILGSNNVITLAPQPSPDEQAKRSLARAGFSEVPCDPSRVLLIGCPTIVATITLDSSQLTSAVPELKQLPSVRLSLSRTQIEDIASLHELTNLEGLDLSATRVASIEPLSGLHRLTALDLGGAKRLRDISAISQIDGLRILNLAGTEIDSLNPLQGVRNLTWLDLHQARIGSIEPLKPLTSLKRLNVAGTGLSNQDLEALQAALPQAAISH